MEGHQLWDCGGCDEPRFQKIARMWSRKQFGFGNRDSAVGDMPSERAMYDGGKHKAAAFPIIDAKLAILYSTTPHPLTLLMHAIVFKARIAILIMEYVISVNFWRSSWSSFGRLQARFANEQAVRLCQRHHYQTCEINKLSRTTWCTKKILAPWRGSRSCSL